MSDAVHFLNPDGQVIAVDPAQAPLLANARGYLPATPQQIEEFQANEQFGSGGQQAIAGLEGLGRGLTARLSTPLELALGVSPEGIKGRMKANPGTAAVGEAAGIALPLVTGIPGASSLIAKAGVAAGRGIAGGAVEGALYGVGNVVHEAALGDPNLTAQSVLAQVGVSAALGGAVSGVIGAAASGLSAALGRAKSAAEGLAEGIATPEKLRGLVQEQHDSVEAAVRLANREIRPAEIGATLTTPPEVAQGELERVAGRIGEVAANMRAQPELFPQPMYPAKLEAIQSALLRGPTDAEGAFNSLNDAKQTIDKQLGKWGRLIAPEQQDAIAAIRGVRTEIKTALENEAVWGPAGARQAEFNDAQSSYFDALKDFRKEFMLKKLGKGLQPKFDMDPGKLSRLSDTANPRYPMRQEIWDRYQAESKNLIGQIEASHSNAPVGNFDKDALESLINKSGEMEQATRQQGSILRMLGRMGGVGPMGTMAGGIVGGPAGAAIGAGIDVIAKGAKFIPRAVDALSHLHANNEAVTQAIEAAAAKLGSTAKGAAKAGRGEVIAGLARTFGMDAEEASAHFDKHATKLRDLANPNQLQAALEEQASGLHEHAPQTAQALAATSARAVAFLASKLPPSTKPGPLSEALPPSQHEISIFFRYQEAVEHPLSILRQARAGTLTPEAIEAVQAVYPHLYRQIQAAVLERLSPDLPYSTRLMASMLMGHDLDGSASPQSIMRTQAMFVRPMPMPQGPVRGGKAKLTMHDRTLTSSQRAVGGSK